MAESLLEQQARLLEHLTSRTGIFEVPRGPSHDPLFGKLDLRLLHLEARFSHEKRMQKIERALTKTFSLLGGHRDVIVCSFVDACPPTTISWLENARQFHNFLKERWTRQAPEPGWLPDVADYELACAIVRSGEGFFPSTAAHVPAGAFRRSRAARLLRCEHDILPLVQGGVVDGAPKRRQALLAVAMKPGRDELLICELSPQLFAVLEMLDDFVESTHFRSIPAVDRMLEEMAACGLVEVQP